MVNIHFSLLPRWRGAAPVERAILAGDRETGVCLMAVEEGLDTGGVYDRRGARDRPARDRATNCGCGWSMPSTDLLLAVLRDGLGDPGAAGGRAHLRREDRRRRTSSSTGRRPRSSSTALCAWAGRGRRSAGSGSRSGERRAHDGRGGSRPGALDGDRVGTGAATLELLEVQPEGKAAAHRRAWLHGARPTPDDRLGA